MGREFQENLHSMITWFLSPKSCGLELDGAHAVKMIAYNIALGYQRLNLEMQTTPTETIIIDELKDTNYLTRDSDYLAPVLELKSFANKKLRKFLLDFLVCGSLATMDYAKGWTDFDTYLIINKRTACDPEALVALRTKLLSAYPYLLQIDRLQHHGFMLCTETDLALYIQSYMPIEVLKLAKSYFGQQEITFRVLDTVKEEKQNFLKRVSFFKNTYEAGILKHHAYKGEYLLSNYRNAKNGMYQFKYLLNYLAIIPSYYLGATGIYCYKRDAIEKIRYIVCGKNWETIDKVSFIRSEWSNRESFPYESNRIPRWVQDIMGPDYFKASYEFISDLARALDSGVSV